MRLVFVYMLVRAMLVDMMSKVRVCIIAVLQMSKRIASPLINGEFDLDL